MDPCLSKSQPIQRRSNAHQPDSVAIRLLSPFFNGVEEGGGGLVASVVRVVTNEVTAVTVESNHHLVPTSAPSSHPLQ